MRFKIKRVRYSDGEKSPWWKIEIYKDGRLYDESDQQWSSLLYTIKVWFIATINHWMI